MNYANRNPNNNDQCFQIDTNIGQHNIASHQINIIKSDDETTALARKMQQELDNAFSTSLIKGYTLPKTKIMTGAVIATIGSRVVKAVALSGYHAIDLTNIIGKAFGKNVAILNENVDPNNFQSILGLNISKKVKKVRDMLRQEKIPEPNFPVGTCAAQKLLYYIISLAVSSDQKITKINMSEIYWKTRGSSDWSTGEPVPSCNTCNYVLPMMLCNYDALGEKTPY